MKWKKFFIDFNWLLILAFVVGSFIRFWGINRLPAAFNVDEASIGYNAYSILRTGRDQFKNFMPISFVSLGDYKPPLYIYSVSMAEAIFGLNEFAVRFPAVLAGSLSIILIYLLTKKLINNRRIAITSAWVLALSPWHIKMSRGSYEACLALFLILLGSYFLIRFTEKKRGLVAGLVFYYLSMFTYHTEKVLVPLLLISFILCFRTKIIFNRKNIGIFLTITAIFVVPFGLSIFNKSGQKRPLDTLLVNDKEIVIAQSEINDTSTLSKNILWGSSAISRYLGYFDPSFYFIDGLDLTLNNRLDASALYMFEIIPLIIGVMVLIRSKDIFKDKSRGYFFLSWMVLSPLAASVTMDFHHNIRALPLVICLDIVIAIGWQKLPKWILILYPLGLLIFLDYYFIHVTYQKSDLYFEKSKEMALAAIKYSDKYERVVIDPSSGKNGPYLLGTPDNYVLFFGKIEPTIYWGEQHQGGFGKYNFRHIDWQLDKATKNTLFIGSPWSLPLKDIMEKQVLERIYYSDGQLAYLIVSGE